MVREHLISSAVSFLQDPSVSSSPIDKRKAFLQSKNLTQEEIDIAIARAEHATPPNTIPPPPNPQSNYQYTNQSVTRQLPPGYGYDSYQGGPWAPLAPAPEPPRRDWRDWFIMATVTGTVSYGLYTIAKRYVLPLIAPPTPPQLEQDKTEIDASFNRAFALIDQLATDTAAIKTAESERTERLDTALQEVESVLSDLKLSNKRREEDSRRIGDEVRALKDAIPKALEGWKSDGDGKLREIGNELSSLKKLVGNRMGNAGPQPPMGRPYGLSIGDRTVSGTNTPRDLSVSGRPYSSSGTGNGNPGTENKDEPATVIGTSRTPSPPPPSQGVSAHRREGSSSLNLDNKPAPARGRAAIPAWQMAASSGNRSNVGSSMTRAGDVNGSGSGIGAPPIESGAEG